MRLLIAGSIVFIAASAVSSQMRIPNRSQPLFKGAQAPRKPNFTMIRLPER